MHHVFLQEQPHTTSANVDMVLRRWGPYIGGIVFAIYLISTLMNWFGSGSSEGKIITLKPNGCQVSPRAPLRIMAIGDSITEGSGSSDHNGYRMVLYEHLKTDCGSRKIEFVGKKESQPLHYSLLTFHIKAPNKPALLQ